MTAVLLAFFGILLLLAGRLHTSFSVMLLATFFDTLDGALSRKFGQESAFGGHLDMIQDAVNYLIYPSILLFTQGFQHWTAIIALGVFVASGTYRLARFNTIGFARENEALGYMGMPTTMNHTATLVFFLLTTPFSRIVFAYCWLPLSSVLMVSAIRFPKPKNILSWAAILLLASAAFLFF